MNASAIAELTAGFERAFPGARPRSRTGSRCRGHLVAVGSGRDHSRGGLAGGRCPRQSGADAAADAVLEPDLFPGRLRQLVEAALTGRLAHSAAIVLPRTSDPDYKCFLYLRELVRRGVVTNLPPVLLFDLLHSASAEVPAYDAARARALLDELAALSQHVPTPDDLRRAIGAANAARAAARRLDAWRHHEPRLTGLEALPLLGAFWQLAPERYVALASAASDAIAARAPIDGPRVLLAGTPVDSPTLHAALESHGAIVVAEVSPFGAGVAGDDVDTATDPLIAIADRYRRSSIDARTPVTVLERSIENALAGIDVVIVSLPPDDASFGWDYPQLRRLLERRSVPHAVLRHDPAQPAAVDDRAHVAALLARVVSRQREARLG